jgi:hypothetical protein
MSPSWGWSLVFPYEYAFGPEGHFLTALWISGLLLPVAYWAHRGMVAERSGALFLLVLLPLIGLGGVAAAMGLPPVHWSEWVAAGIGIAGGWAIGGASRRYAGECTEPVRP